MRWFEFTPCGGGDLVVARVMARVFAEPGDSLRLRPFLVDSGASATLAPRSWCPERLLRERPEEPSGLLDASGRPISGIRQELYVEIERADPIRCPIWFCAQLPDSRPGLLGLAGWFDRHHVRFRCFPMGDRAPQFGLSPVQ